MLCKFANEFGVVWAVIYHPQAQGNKSHPKLCFINPYLLHHSHGSA